MGMYTQEGREMDAEREEREHRRSEPISVRKLDDFPDEPHWVIMTVNDQRGPDTHRLTYTAYLDKAMFERSVIKMAGREFKAFHVDSIAKVTVEVKI